MRPRALTFRSANGQTPHRARRKALDVRMIPYDTRGRSQRHSSQTKPGFGACGAAGDCPRGQRSADLPGRHRAHRIRRLLDRFYRHAGPLAELHRGVSGQRAPSLVLPRPEGGAVVRQIAAGVQGGLDSGRAGDDLPGGQRGIEADAVQLDRRAGRAGVRRGDADASGFDRGAGLHAMHLLCAALLPLLPQCDCARRAGRNAPSEDRLRSPVSQTTIRSSTSGRS